jgi:hypothetical protein
MLEILEPLFADVRRGVFEVRQGIGDYIYQTAAALKQPFLTATIGLFIVAQRHFNRVMFD